MKKRNLLAIISCVFVAVSIATFFMDYIITVREDVAKIIPAIIILLAGCFLAYSNFEHENKTIRVYMYCAAGALALLGIMPILAAAAPYLFSIEIPIFVYSISALVGSLFTLASNLK